MKIIKKFILCTIVISALFTVLVPNLVYATSDSESLSEFEENLASKMYSFTNDLRPDLEDQVGDNLVYSPLSYYLALMALEPGLGEDEQDLFLDVLIPEGIEPEVFLSQTGEFLTFAQEKEEPLFNTETFLLGRDDLEWNEDYIEAVEPLATSPRLIDFQDASSYESLNEEIAEITEGLIDPYYSDDRIQEMASNDYLQMIIMNVLHFKSGWRSAFNEGATTTKPFYGRDEETEVEMMHKETQFVYMETDELQAIQIPYVNGAYLLVVLPEEGTAEEVMWRIYSEALYNGDFSRYEVNLSIPKWESSASLDLTDTLEALGLEALQEDLGDTNFFTDSEPTAISQILQSVEFKLDEEGTEAAAVTEINIETTAAPVEDEPIEMVVNRPFMYGIIYEGIPIFEGVINNLE